jgi:hypothetical protein
VTAAPADSKHSQLEAVAKQLHFDAVASGEQYFASAEDDGEAVPGFAPDRSAGSAETSFIDAAAIASAGAAAAYDAHGSGTADSAALSNREPTSPHEPVAVTDRRSRTSSSQTSSSSGMTAAADPQTLYHSPPLQLAAAQAVAPMSLADPLQQRGERAALAEYSGNAAGSGNVASSFAPTGVPRLTAEQWRGMGVPACHAVALAGGEAAALAAYGWLTGWQARATALAVRPLPLSRCLTLYNLAVTAGHPPAAHVHRGAAPPRHDTALVRGPATALCCRCAGSTSNRNGDGN